MKRERIMEKMDPPKTLDEIEALARYGAKVKIVVRPVIHKYHPEPGRATPSFQLAGEFHVTVGGVKALFEKSYAKGHEVAPPLVAANGFVIANTRLHRDVKSLEACGVKCDAAPFILSDLLPGTDLSVFEPKKIFSLDDFAVLAGIGVPVAVSMSSHTRRLDEEGKVAHELFVIYNIHCRGVDYALETRHGRFYEDDDEARVERVYEIAQKRLDMEQHKLRRVGVDIAMSRPWAGAREMKPALALIKDTGARLQRMGADEIPSRHVGQR